MSATYAPEPFYADGLLIATIEVDAPDVDTARALAKQRVRDDGYRCRGLRDVEEPTPGHWVVVMPVRPVPA